MSKCPPHGTAALHAQKIQRNINILIYNVWNIVLMHIYCKYEKKTKAITTSIGSRTYIRFLKIKTHVLCRHGAILHLFPMAQTWTPEPLIIPLTMKIRQIARRISPKPVGNDQCADRSGGQYFYVQLCPKHIFDLRFWVLILWITLHICTFEVHSSASYTRVAIYYDFQQI